MVELLTVDNLMALLALTSLEIVLGIDNVVFISILAGKLPTEAEQKRARNIGLMLAMGLRIVLLLAISWIMGLKETLFVLPILEKDISGKDLILIGGGMFLLAKATFEIHEKLEAEPVHGPKARVGVTMGAVLFQIVMMDMIFSLDSVITAVGMADEIIVMIIAVVIAIGVMMLSAGAVSRFIEKHPTMKMLALSFLLLIGFALTSEGLGLHIQKGYIYFAMGFSIFVEFLNLRLRSKKTVKLNPHYKEVESGEFGPEGRRIPATEGSASA